MDGANRQPGLRKALVRPLEALQASRIYAKLAGLSLIVESFTGHLWRSFHIAFPNLLNVRQTRPVGITVEKHFSLFRDPLKQLRLDQIDINFSLLAKLYCGSFLLGFPAIFLSGALGISSLEYSSNDIFVSP